jgi:hypothetical protein
MAQDRPGSAARTHGFGPTLAVLTVVFLLGIALIGTGVAEGLGPPRPAGADGAVRAGPRPHEPMRPSRPTAVRIPAIGVDASLTGVGLDREGWLTAPPPEEAGLAGWYRDGVTPGAKGTAVLAGHVDTEVGRGVFYAAGSLHRGNTVQVARADGRTAVFTVYRVRLYADDTFPGRRIYAPTGHAELRLLTCGGAYVPGSGYQGNTVVFARLTAVRKRPGPTG